MKKVLFALLGIAMLASCKKDVPAAEGAGYKSTPLLWINNTAPVSGQTLMIGSTNDLLAKVFMDLKTQCTIYCNVTINDLGLNGNQTLGNKYSGPNIPVTFTGTKPDGSNGGFIIASPGDIAAKVLNNVYELNLVFTGPDIAYYKEFKFRIKRY